MQQMPTITPSLWFDNDLEDAMAFYTSVFPNSSIEFVNRYTDAGPGRIRARRAAVHRHQRRPGRCWECARSSSPIWRRRPTTDAAPRHYR
jgi:hypothetical protein